MKQNESPHETKPQVHDSFSTARLRETDYLCNVEELTINN